MCSLVMSPFSRDYMKTEIDQLKYQQCFTIYAEIFAVFNFCGFRGQSINNEIYSVKVYNLAYIYRISVKI